MGTTRQIQADWREWMGLALEQARMAGEMGEIPVGALLLDEQGSLLARDFNQCIHLQDPTGHAEILTLRRAAKAMGNYRLPGTVMVCTLEPCLMCLGAMTQARVSGLVFGTRDPAGGAVVSRLGYPQELPWLNHHFWWREGFIQDQCADLLKSFFQARRKGGSAQEKC